MSAQTCRHAQLDLDGLAQAQGVTGSAGRDPGNTSDAAGAQLHSRPEAGRSVTIAVAVTSDSAADSCTPTNTICRVTCLHPVFVAVPPVHFLQANLQDKYRTQTTGQRHHLDPLDMRLL
jgi:hypothetical protein